MQVNANHVIYTAKAMIGQLVKRYDTTNKRSAIVVTASIAALHPASGSTTYSATKTFASYLAEGLNYELK